MRCIHPYPCAPGPLFVLLWLLLLGPVACAQSVRPDTVSRFSGTLTLTQNGISIIPTFSLDKPALIFNLAVGRGRLTFEPDLRFSLEGKPWSMLFWWRYRVLRDRRFSLRVGAHPAMNFRTVDMQRTPDGTPEEVIEARRYLATEVVPSYRLTDRLSLGLYYLSGWGFDDGVQRTHFLTLNAALTPLARVGDWSLQAFPSAFYLRTDDLQGYYGSATLRVQHARVPLALESILNHKISTEIAPERVLVWNISLRYTFNRRFVDYRPQQALP
ncbi:hypothetical protein [Neolewinella maritima]|nr:hypothetical protein [Neolewinella maritima]